MLTTTSIEDKNVIITTLPNKNKEIRKNYQKTSEEKLGETRLNNMGSKMWIIEYVNYHNLTVQFANGYICNTQYSNFKLGKVKNPYDASVFGVGYLGIGDYKATIDGKNTEQYDRWMGMLGRCYNKKRQEKNPSYKGCTVCDEWHNFQHFAKWFDENYYTLIDERVELDKDLLIKNNKIYSPSTCCFLPQSINTLIVKNDINRGEYPIGVNYDKYSGKFKAYCKNGTGKQKHLGLFLNPESAFYAHKIYKESFIKFKAEKYKDYITNEAYRALMNYSVNIND